MVLKIQKISAVPLGIILCCMHTIVGLILGVIVSVGSLTNAEEGGLWDLGVWAILVLPLINAALGFITGLFLAGAYNLLVQWFGRAIELEVEQ